MDIDFAYLEKLNIIADSGVPINEKETQFLVEPAEKGRCRLCQEKVKANAQDSGLDIFDE